MKSHGADACEAQSTACPAAGYERGAGVGQALCWAPGEQWWVGGVMAPQNVYILIPGAWEGKGDFADGMKLRF